MPEAARRTSEILPVGERMDVLDWKTAEESLSSRGYAVVDPILSPAECASLTALYKDESRFRSQIIMERYRFGIGDYKYFGHPLPELVANLRTKAYPHLAGIANRWAEALGMTGLRYPEDHAAFLRVCRKADSQKGGVVLGIPETRHTQSLGPAIRDSGEMRVGLRPQIRDQFRERMAEVFVIADAKPIALHDDLTAKAALIFIQRRERCTFGGGENRVHDRVSAAGKRFLRSLPIQGVHSFADRKNLRSFSSWLWHAFPREPRMPANQTTV